MGTMEDGWENLKKLRYPILVTGVILMAVGFWFRLSGEVIYKKNMMVENHGGEASFIFGPVDLDPGEYCVFLQISAGGSGSGDELADMWSASLTSPQVPGWEKTRRLEHGRKTPAPRQDFHFQADKKGSYEFKFDLAVREDLLSAFVEVSKVALNYRLFFAPGMALLIAGGGISIIEDRIRRAKLSKPDNIGPDGKSY